MYLNHLGRIVEASWLHLPRHYPRVLLDAFVVMPNHIHGIVILDELLDPSIRKPPGLSQVIGSLKTDSAKRINNVRSSRGVAVWQRSFHDQIIRNEQHLDNVRAYITNNPARWHDDAENPDTW
jgi:REP element-mobilizing transposase RayT